MRQNSRSRSPRDRKSHRKNRKHRRNSDSESSSSIYSSDSAAETNAAYELYKRLKKERKEASAQHVTCRPLDLESDFPNYKRKLVV
jgi:hypothetical protein